jgi:hypothetical protein
MRPYTDARGPVQLEEARTVRPFLTTDIEDFFNPAIKARTPMAGPRFAQEHCLAPVPVFSSQIQTKKFVGLRVRARSIPIYTSAEEGSDQ